MILSVICLLVLRIEGQETCPCTKYNDIEKECSKIDSSLTCRPIEEIFGGTPANTQDWPYIISIQQPYLSKGPGCFWHTCGGVLIAPNLVLSAAHCYDSILRTQTEGAVGSSQIVAAHAPLCRHQASGSRRIEITYIYLHPQWNRRAASADFAILVLAQNLPGPYIKLQQEFMDSIQTQTITIAGWGAVNPEESEKSVYNIRQLQQANLNYVDNAICKFFMRDFGSAADNLNETSMLCAYNAMADSCGGDSGGPAVLKGETPSEDVLVGVMSWGPAGQCTSLDRGQAPAIFARVSTFKEWIEEVILQHQIGSVVPRLESSVLENVTLDPQQP